MTIPGYDYDKDIPAGFYDEIHQRKAGVRFFWHDLKFRAVAARLEGAGKVLDIGCGPGTFIGNYLDGVDCLGIDFSAPQIDYANRRYGDGRASLLDAGARRPRCQRFDAITMIELIEHLPPADARRLLAEARGLLSPQGRLVVTTPNYRSLWPLIEWGVNLVSPRQLRAAARQQIRARAARRRPCPGRLRHGRHRHGRRPRAFCRRARPASGAMARCRSSAASAISAAATS